MAELGKDFVADQDCATLDVSTVGCPSGLPTW